MAEPYADWWCGVCGRRTARVLAEHVREYDHRARIEKWPQVSADDALLRELLHWLRVYSLPYWHDVLHATVHVPSWLAGVVTDAAPGMTEVPLAERLRVVAAAEVDHG